jgi:predicted nucleic acid-binding protein
MLRRDLLVYVDASVVGGCEDQEFATDSLALWRRFVDGRYTLVLSAHTLRELEGAPEKVSAHLDEVPEFHQTLLPDSAEATDLAAAYIQHGILGPGSRADALHIALATTGRVDVLVSWNFRHIVNLGRIRLFNAVNLEQGYGVLEIRTPKEVLEYEESF